MSIQAPVEYVPSENAPLPPELWPNVDHLVTEDETPVENIFSEKQMRLLAEVLYSSWPGPGSGGIFLAGANVSLFYAIKEPPLVPDLFLSLGVTTPENLFPKRNRSYFFWEYGKPPEVVVEIVSNKEGGELDRKRDLYARIGILYYVVWDPDAELSPDRLQGFVLREKKYESLTNLWLPAVDLGLTLWQGHFENAQGEWLRWCDQEGKVISTGKERAEQEHQRAEQLAAQLRALGVKLPGE